MPVGGGGNVQAVDSGLLDRLAALSTTRPGANAASKSAATAAVAAPHDVGAHLFPPPLLPAEPFSPRQRLAAAAAIQEDLIADGSFPLASPTVLFLAKTAPAFVDRVIAAAQYRHQLPQQPASGADGSWASSPASSMSQQPAATKALVSSYLRSSLRGTLLVHYFEVLGMSAKDMVVVAPHAKGGFYGVMMRIEFFKRIGVKEAAIGKMLIRYSRVLGLHVEKNMIPTLQYLEDIGVDRKDFGKMVASYPQLLSFNVDDNLQVKVEYLKSIGIMREELGKVLSRQPQLLGRSLDKQLYLAVKSLTKAGFSQNSIASMIMRYPALLCHSVEHTLIPKLHYALDTMQRLHNELVIFPQYFGYSLEGRIKLRHEVLARKGRKVSLGYMLVASDDVFAARFSIPIEWLEVPQGSEVLDPCSDYDVAPVDERSHKEASSAASCQTALAGGAASEAIDRTTVMNAANP
eukprot:SM000311S11926  [mRNA]  locus=s311:100913:105357:- [translate_table: standard]